MPPQARPPRACAGLAIVERPSLREVARSHAISTRRCPHAQTDWAEAEMVEDRTGEHCVPRMASAAAALPAHTAGDRRWRWRIAPCRARPLARRRSAVAAAPGSLEFAP